MTQNFIPFNMEEVWKAIKGYEGLYEVSTNGRIRSLTHETISSIGKRRKFIGKLIVQRTLPSGYKQVGLYKNGEYSQFLVHRIVLSTFRGESKLEVNHIDENVKNNCLSNLEWVTKKENCNYGTRNKRISISKKGKDTARCCDRKGDLNPNSVKVYALNKDMTINMIYSCYREAADVYGICESTISRRARHMTNTNEYKGLLWYNENNLPYKV